MFRLPYSRESLYNTLKRLVPELPLMLEREQNRAVEVAAARLYAGIVPAADPVDPSVIRAAVHDLHRTGSLQFAEHKQVISRHEAVRRDREKLAVTPEDAESLLLLLQGGDPDMPETIQPLAWLEMAMEELGHPDVRAIIDRDDPDSAWEMIRDLKALARDGREILRAIRNKSEPEQTPSGP